ncbi:PilZ domain-containing protein [Sphingobium sp.]|uniref:PilZ domain-containing protein n=1 Tax=Sphingobium sp. TaxID=1912891 RepID=UPI002BE3E692|nr:PilZ domain-containing protein [Sphingobium sp.]HUD95712.1 PilZ domain-containing protein [Sphingobium sp.]
MIDNESLVAARRAVRLKLFEPVVLRVHGVAERAHLLDLSATGALAHCEQPPYTGDAVRIEGETLSITGRVMWVLGKRFGIHFDRTLTDTMVLRVVEGD